eukprot:TRINITY_DN6644_c0_g1_i3.p1 TRINITY_DN6644_c0_g1~~TRINITY_DN6644_c0_g1_i3.p1  ORF type:complete len:377 (-),score=136.53 TRINITY_DN6644_c0_g1_i3:115-1182(-)
MSLEHSTIFLNQLAGYSLTEADKKSVDPAALLARLVQWTGCRDEEKVGRVLVGLAELLTQENCKQVGAALLKLDKRQQMWISSSVAGSVTAGVLGEWSELVDSLIDLDEGNEQIWRLRASFVNKCPALADRMTVPNEGVGWICIGLARRGDGLATPWLDRLVCQLSLPGDEGRRAASMMGRLVADCWWRQPVTGLLYRQRVWAQLQPQLSKEQGISQNHLTAIVLLIPHLPRQILLPSLPILLPMVVKALSSPGTAHSALTCLDDITKSSPSMVSSHLSEIVHHCLDLSKDSPLHSRILSLTILSSCSKIEGPTIVQLSAKVTKDLAIPLRDRKRVVRVEAAKTRNLWFLVTQPS